MGTRTRANHRREHIAKRFDEAQRFLTFTASPTEPFVSMVCSLCAADVPGMPPGAGRVCSWPIAAAPTLGDLIDRAGIHFAQAHRRG